jgi:hypothetical protein
MQARIVGRVSFDRREPRRERPSRCGNDVRIALATTRMASPFAVRANAVIADASPRPHS